MDLRLICFWAAFIVLISANSLDSKIDLALLGPVYQAASNASYQAFKDAKSQAAAALMRAVATGNTSYGPFDNQTTSFSVSVFDLSDKPLFNFHFEAFGLNGSYTKGNLSDDTIYRTGSIGKLLTMYLWMVDIGDSVFLDPVTKYLVSARICLG